MTARLEAIKFDHNAKKHGIVDNEECNIDLKERSSESPNKSRAIKW
jgi:hypothetical protein